MSCNKQNILFTLMFRDLYFEITELFLLPSFDGHSLHCVATVLTYTPVAMFFFQDNDGKS